MTPDTTAADYLQNCLNIELSDLNDEFVRLPGDVAYWNEQLANATRKSMTAKLDVDRARGQLFIQMRNSGGAKPPAVEAVKAAIDADPDIYELELQHIMLDADRIRIRGIVDAVIAKRDMIQSLGAKLRAEMRSEPSINHAL